VRKRIGVSAKLNIGASKFASEHEATPIRRPADTFPLPSAADLQDLARNVCCGVREEP
jgi:hypothetical protein